jgi:hypothetical protein
MKKLLAMLAIALLASSAMATVDPDPDGMGVYFDLDGDVVCTTTAAPFSNVVAYLLATNPSTGISGWEANIDVLGAAVAPAWTLAAGLDVDMSAAGFQVGIGTGALALPAAPAVVLATWSGFVMAPTDVIEFFVSGVPGSSSFPDSPGYAAGDNAGDLREFQVSSGTGMNLPVAGINTCTVVANEDMTFTNVKSLYR